MPKGKKRDGADESMKMIERPQAAFPTVPIRKRWRACSNLKWDGKLIATPGKIVLLTDKQAEHYLEAAPGSIEPAE